MRFQQAITFEQYRNTCQAVSAAKRKQVQRRSWKEYLILIVAGFVLALAPQVPAARVPTYTIYAVMALVWLFSKPLAKRSRERCLKAIYSEEQEKLDQQVLTIDESGISCEQADGQANSYHSWQDFVMRIDMPDAFVFLPSANSFIRVPKEMLTPPDREVIWRWSSTFPTEGNH